MDNKKVSFKEPKLLLIGIILAIFSAIICMQIIGKVGVTPNTSLIGAIVAMIISRLPFKGLKIFKNLERQNLLQTIVSGAGFSAANSAFLTLGIFFILGEKKLIVPMALGVCIGVVISIIVVGNIFDSQLFPAESSWPPGVATANAIDAGDQGGKKGIRLLEGIIIGAIASYFKLPAAGIGIVFIANIFSMVALGLGLIIRGYSINLFNFDLGSSYIPHGIMIGAGLMALIQSAKIIFGNDISKENFVTVTVNKKNTEKRLLQGIVLFLVSVIILSLITGIAFEMKFHSLLLWILWSTFSATASMLLVGMAAMHSGWFPAFAITTIFMTIGMFLGFEKIPLAILTGFISSVGPCFADMGYDLKTGWILRGKGNDKSYELYGRKQQVIIELIGGIIGVLVVFFTMDMYFEQGIVPPVSKVFATTILASADFNIIKQLIIWAIPGFLIQFLGGSSKMIGVLFATGLLINNPIYGIGVLSAILVRIIFGTEFMEVRDAGLIAGDGLFGFFYSLIKSLI